MAAILVPAGSDVSLTVSSVVVHGLVPQEESDLRLQKRFCLFDPIILLWFLQDQNLGNWQLKRQVGSGAPIVFKFPAKFTLKAGQRVTVGTCSPQPEPLTRSRGSNLLLSPLRTDLGF